MSKKDKYIFMVNEEYSFAEDESPFLFVGDVIELVCEGNVMVKEVIVLTNHVIFYLETVES